MSIITSSAAAMTPSRVTYELCFDPAEGDTFVYRNVQAGICGPFGPKILATSREEAAAWAFAQGYLVSGIWESHLNGDTVSLAHMGFGG